jgi:tetratricopeptide (TPR) repeat protein
MSNRKNRRVWTVLAVCALAAGGCNKQGKTVVIPDDSAVRRADAERLAFEAYRADQQGDSKKAVELYQQSLNRSRDLYFVWHNLGLLLMEQDNYAEAAEMFKTAAELQPSEPGAFYNIGLMYQKRDYDERAMEYFIKSLARDRRYLPSLRGAVISGKRLDVTDEAALERVRTALMTESDPEWLRIFQTEQLRIEGSMVRAKQGLGSRPVRNQTVTPPGTPEPTPPAAPEPGPAGG